MKEEDSLKSNHSPQQVLVSMVLYWPSGIS